MKVAALLVVMVVLAFPGQALAVSTGSRNITNIGCHLGDDTCWIDISGSAVGPSGCTSNQIRFSVNSTNGKSVFSLLTAAFLAGKQVNLEVTNTCYLGNTVYPTIGWLNVSPT
jgi:hypothetical protein